MSLLREESPEVSRLRWRHLNWKGERAMEEEEALSLACRGANLGDAEAPESTGPNLS
jgi:hypothetical protein